MDVVVRFMQAKKEHPDYKKYQLCALIGVSDSHLKRVMKDLDIKSFYRHDIPVNKKKSIKKKEQQRNIENPQGDTQSTSKKDTEHTETQVKPSKKKTNLMPKSKRRL